MLRHKNIRQRSTLHTSRATATATAPADESGSSLCFTSLSFGRTAVLRNVGPLPAHFCLEHRLILVFDPDMFLIITGHTSLCVVSIQVLFGENMSASVSFEHKMSLPERTSNTPSHPGPSDSSHSASIQEGDISILCPVPQCNMFDAVLHQRFKSQCVRGCGL